MMFWFSFRLLVLFGITFSLAALPSPILTHNLVPTVPKAIASLAPAEPWYPAGPTMDTLVYKIYSDVNAELTDLGNGQIDLPDMPLPPSMLCDNCLQNFYVTQPISGTAYAELQFHLGNGLWGCLLDFGNSQCGVEIRQGIAHGLDRTKLTQLQGSLAGVSTPIDNPVPPVLVPVIPNPCNWDVSHPQSGSSCVVGEGGMSGGVAYHLAPASTCGLGSCASTPSFPWTPGLGTPDFCAAADHFIAAGIATGKSGTLGTGTCVLTGISTQASNHAVNIFIRSDDAARNDAGVSIAQFLCALFTGVFTTGCLPYVYSIYGDVTQFPGFTTSPSAVIQSWNIYTAKYLNILTFDQPLYFSYESRFVSGIPSIKQSGGGPCSDDSIPSNSAPNYMYLCGPNYDSEITQAVFAACMSAPGDPTNGQTAPTFATCSNGLPTATSASYRALDEFGKNAFTIPWWAYGAYRFAYPINWQRAVLHKSNGFTPPGNIPAEFNAWSPNPALPGTIRQGYSEQPTSANPFMSNTAWDLGLSGNIYDAPHMINPDSPQNTLDWMTTSTRVLSNFSPGCTNCISYTAPAYTVQTLRYTFRTDIRWQTGQPFTAFDAAFSYVAWLNTGSVPGSLLAPVAGIKVASSNVMDVNVRGVGPFTMLFLSSPPVVPGRFWVDPAKCTPAQWDANANAAIAATTTAAFGTAWTSMQPCITSSVLTSGTGNTPIGVFTPDLPGSAVDQNKVIPSFDPIASGIFVGSGPWVCRSSSGVVGQGCTSSGTQNVRAGGTITLQRYGLGTAPGGSLNTYFRSSGNLALWAWTGNTGNFGEDFLNVGVVSLCFGKTPVPAGCNRWSMGIGNPEGSASSPAVISVVQIGIVVRFIGVNWVSPYSWTGAPPQGIVAFPPVLYEGSSALNPATLVGCTNSFHNGGGYDC